MKSNPATRPIPVSLSAKDAEQLEASISKIGELISKLRVAARSLEHSDAYMLDHPEHVYESTLFLQACSEVLTDVCRDLFDIQGKCLNVLPAYKDDTAKA